jgi:DNA-binding winged helix-turn-helix (wHTH) protein/TolB-like protein
MRAGAVAHRIERDGSQREQLHGIHFPARSGVNPRPVFVCQCEVRGTLLQRTFEILVLLVERRGALVTKGELLNTVWPDTFVEENNLTQYVSMLRKALSDGAEDQKYIQTVPKLGYRFVSNISEIPEPETAVLVAKHTHTRIVMREEEEKEEEVREFPGASAFAARSIAQPDARWRPARTWVVDFVASPLAAGAAIAVFSNFRSNRTSDPAPSVPPPASVVPPAKPHYSIAVLGFKNLSGRPEDEWLSAALAEMLTTELLTGGQLRIVSGEEVHRIKSDLKLENDQGFAKPTLAQIRNRVGADLVVSGSYTEVGREPDRQIRLDLRLQDTTAGETVFSTAVSGRTRELFTLVSPERRGTSIEARCAHSFRSGRSAGPGCVAFNARSRAPLFGWHNETSHF